MTVGMKEDTVFCSICATFASPDHMMTMPSGDLGDFLVAHGTLSVLFLPKMQELSFPSEVLLCFHVETFFKVCFPGWIERVSSSPNGNVPLDFYVAGSSEINGLRLSFLVLDFSCKHPVVTADGDEVFLLHPGRAFFGVSSPGPPPQLFEDRTVHKIEGFATGPEPMIICPSSYHGIKLDGHLSSRAILVFFDDPPNFLQERFHVLFGRHGQNHAVAVLAYMLSKEVETVLDMSDDRLFLRQLESSFFQERLDEWFHLLLQKSFRCSCYHKIVGIPCHVHFWTLSP